MTWERDGLALLVIAAVTLGLLAVAVATDWYDNRAKPRQPE